jgi:hypothetical protein
MSYLGSDILQATAPTTEYTTPTNYTLNPGYYVADGFVYDQNGANYGAVGDLQNNPDIYTQSQGQQQTLWNPYQTTQADPSAGLSTYWGKQGATGDPSSQLQSMVWGAYNNLIQAHPDLAGQILNPDAIAQMAFESRMQADPSQDWTNAIPGDQWNIPQTGLEMVNALYNQAPVLKALGQTSIDVTTTPQAQQAIQAGNDQALANFNYAQNYGS